MEEILKISDAIEEKIGQLKKERRKKSISKEEKEKIKYVLECLNMAKGNISDAIWELENM